MPRFTGKIDTLKLNSEEYFQDIVKALENQFRRAARAFIRAAIPRIPVQTGMAQGSYLNIGRFLNLALPIPSRPRTRFNDWYYLPSGGKIRKNPEAGASLSTPPARVITLKGNSIQFEFESNVFHYTLEDIIGVRSPTAPWKSLEAGRSAFMLELSKFKSRFPNVKSYLIRTTISFGRSGVQKSSPKRLRERKQQKVGD